MCNKRSCPVGGYPGTRPVGKCPHVGGGALWEGGASLLLQGFLESMGNVTRGESCVLCREWLCCVPPSPAATVSGQERPGLQARTLQCLLGALWPQDYGQTRPAHLVCPAPQMAAYPIPASLELSATASPTAPGLAAAALWASWATAPTVRTWMRCVCPDTWYPERGCAGTHTAMLISFCLPCSALWSWTSASPPTRRLAVSTPSLASTACPARLATRGPSLLGWAWRLPGLRSR